MLVVGAGQAGLSSAYHLRRRGLVPWRDFVVLDGYPRPGGAWQFRWPSLTFGRVHGLFSLPGLALGEVVPHPDPDRPSAEVVGEYFAAYEHAFELPVLRPVRVTAIREAGDGRLRAESTAGEWSAHALINATGTWERPFWPRVPGQETFRGWQLHTAQYHGPEEFAGRRVVIVGGGSSAVQHLLDLSGVAAETTWVTRRPPVFLERGFGEVEGRAAVAQVEERVRRGLPPGSVVSVTGLPPTGSVALARERGLLHRQPMFDRITPQGVAWSDGRSLEADTILWATGFRAALNHLAPLRLREAGGGIALEGTRVVRDARVHLVGYGPSASTVGANRAGRAAVNEILRLPGLAAAGAPAAAGRAAA